MERQSGIAKELIKDNSYRMILYPSIKLQAKEDNNI